WRRDAQQAKADRESRLLPKRSAGVRTGLSAFAFCWVSSPFSWRPSSASIFWPFYLARLSFWPLSWPAFWPLAWVLLLGLALLPRALRRQSPNPLPRSRRFLPFRPPALRGLPAETPRCRLRNCPSRNPYHPPLGESRAMHKRALWVAVLAGVASNNPPRP